MAKPVVQVHTVGHFQAAEEFGSYDPGWPRVGHAWFPPLCSEVIPNKSNLDIWISGSRRRPARIQLSCAPLLNEGGTRITRCGSGFGGNNDVFAEV